MGISGHDKFEGENRNEGQIHYNSANLSSDWPFTSPNNLTNTSSNPIDNTSSSSASMADSFCQTAPTIWDHHPTNLGNLVNPSRNLEMSWAPPNSAIKGGDLFLPQAASAMIPHSLSQIPADSGFIERAARYSCFGGGNFGDMMNPFGNVHESLSAFNRANEGFVWNGLKSVSGEGSKDASMAVDCDGSQLKNERQSESFVMSIDEAKCAGISGNNGADEAEFSEGGGAGQQENSNEGFGSKRRRRNGQDIEHDQVRGSPQALNESTINNNSEIQEKGDNNPNSGTNNNNNKSSGKHGKSRSQASDTQKEEYIHVRARRGQATNSHSLAERVRREKISERMKFLQDLVPGCNKVTGKAVMLDEIINYVQSLQRQVEFLSMKLATVNPRMDFSIESLLAKDMIRSQAAGAAGGLGFGGDMSMSYRPVLHPSQTGIMQSGVGSSSSDAVRRTINSHLAAISGGGYKDPNSQVPNAWDDELHNIVQMGLNSTTPQDLGSTPPGHLKTDT